VGVKRLLGRPASAGIARGPWRHVAPAALPAGGRITARAAEDEVQRLSRSVETAAIELEVIAQRVERSGRPDEASIFVAQAAMARDPALRGMAEQRIRESSEDAIAAVLGAASELADQLRALQDELLSARAADLLDVAARVARRAAGVPDPAEPLLDEAAVVVAADLPPSLTATLPRELLRGIALEEGSPTAHAAILARAYGIPAVVGVAGLLAELAASGEVGIALDGSSGEVVLAPDPATEREFARRARGAKRAHARALAGAELPAETRDGCAVTLLANLGSPAEASRARDLGARGVGLFRTEFLFLERSAAPDEEEQLAAYAEVVRAFAPGAVTIRLLDVGGDKLIPFLPQASEANPFLGVRALRLAAERPQLFVTQLRAAMRAALEGPVKVMAPMIADADDAALFEGLVAQARHELEETGVPHGAIALGVMLEIPSAILVAESYFAGLDFASLGTNDLLQYTLAADRGNPGLVRYQEPLHPALLRLVAHAVERAAAAGIELSVCGEMAGDPAAALALVGLGIRSLSMAAGSLDGVRAAIRGAELDRLQDAALAALSARSARDVRARFEALAGLPAG
jgi:phosphoenolpyruvate-protein phosphotransferase